MSVQLGLSSYQMIEMAIFPSSSFSGGSTYNLLNGSTSYTYFTGNGFQYDVKVLKIYNGTTNGIVLSINQIVYEGVQVNVPNDYLPPGGTLIVDLQANHADASSYGSGILQGRAGQLIWGNSTAGTGNIYISGFR